MLDRPTTETLGEYGAEAISSLIQTELDKTDATVKVYQDIKKLSNAEARIQGAFTDMRITEAGNTLKQVAAAAGYQKALMNLTPEYERLQGHLTNTSAIVKKVREDKRADLKKAQALINS